MRPGRHHITPAIIMIGSMLMIVLAMEHAAFANQGGTIGIVSAVFGAAEVTHKDEAKPVAVARRQKVYPLDKFATREDAKIRILFEDGSVLTIAEKTTIEINEFVYSPLEKERVGRLSLALGKIRVVASNLFGFRDSRFTVNTPTATIGTRGTEHIDHVYQDQATGQLVTQVAVLDGAVGVTNPRFPAVEQVVRQFESIIVRFDAPPESVRSLEPAALQQMKQGVYFRGEPGRQEPPQGGEDRGVFDTRGAGLPPREWDPGTNPDVGGATLGGGAPDARGVNTGDVQIHWNLR